MNFHETTYGRRFFDAQLPHLIKALERIADGLAHTETAPPQGIAPDPNFLHDLYYGIRIKVEEKALYECFGEDFKNYCFRSWRLIPLIW